MGFQNAFSLYFRLITADADRKCKTFNLRFASFVQHFYDDRVEHNWIRNDVEQNSSIYMFSLYAQRGVGVVHTPAFGSEGPRFDPRQQPLVQLL